MKIAICISGQTRDWDDEPSKNLAYYISCLEKYGHEVDVVGHTWSHCTPPSEEHVKFKKLIIEDQVIIDNWVLTDWTNRLTFNKELCELFNYDPTDHDEYDLKNIEYDRLSNDTINKVLQYCRAGYGQHVSGWKSFQLADNGYDMYIRWRWDLIFTNLVDTKSDIKDIIDFYVPYINEVIKSFHSLTFSSTDNLHVLFGGNSIIHTKDRSCVDDLFFAFTSTAKQKIDGIDIFDAIDKCFDPTMHHTPLNKALYHTLWTWCMTDLIEMEGVCRLPACVSMTHSESRNC
jgi:hypothetical protein